MWQKYKSYWTINVIYKDRTNCDKQGPIWNVCLLIWSETPSFVRSQHDCTGLMEAKAKCRPTRISIGSAPRCTGWGKRVKAGEFFQQILEALWSKKYKHKGAEPPRIQKMWFFISDLWAALGFAISSLLLRTAEMGKQSGAAISILCIWQLFHLPEKSPLPWVRIAWVLGNHDNINICQSSG